jgi:ATP-dependent Clp protease ATP-binding subunit ClpA
MTRRRLLRFVLLLYPSWWRDQYGAEAAAVLDQMPPTAWAALDLLRGVVDAWVRQRPPRRSFARFSDAALEIVVLAQKEARALGHGHVGTEHIVLGILAAQDAVAARALGGLGVSAAAVRARLLQVLEQGFAAPCPPCRRRAACADLPKWSMRLTPRAKEGFDRSCRAADRLGDAAVDPVHLLLGLLDEGEGVGARILAEFAAPETVRERVPAFRGGA